MSQFAELNRNINEWLPLIYVFVGLLGAVIGSFLNVVIYRVPRKESVAFPASHCPSCGAEIKWYDNIPIFSYLFLLGGKCRNCKEHISFRYTVVEALNMLLWIGCVYFLVQKSQLFLGVQPAEGLAYAFIAMVASSIFLCVMFIDIEHMIIPDRFQVMLAVLGVCTILINLFTNMNDGISWLERLIGGVGGGVLFLAIYYGAILVLKREGMGFGDVKLVAVVGLLIGWKNLALAILVAAIAACVGIVLPHFMHKDGERFKEYPFGPYLVGGMMVAMLFGRVIINWYLSLM